MAYASLATGAVTRIGSQKTCCLLKSNRSQKSQPSHYAEIRIRLETNVTPIPANDIWIAAIALELKLPFLSNDHHFDLIPKLDRVSF